jgi:hypothetical protein
LFQGTEFLTLAKSFSNIYDALTDNTFGTVIVGFTPHGTPNAEVIDYPNGCLIAGSAATPSIGLSDAGTKVAAYDGFEYKRVYSGQPIENDFNVLATRWNSWDLQQKLNDGEWVSTAFTNGNGLDDGNGGNVGSSIEIGRSFAGGEFFRGVIHFIYVCPFTLDNSEFPRYVKWARSRGLFKANPISAGPSAVFQTGGFTNSETHHSDFR